jgi:argininosuccinate lyase
MRQFNDSLAFDQRLYAVDIMGSQAYAAALAGAQVISEAECKQLVAGLDLVRSEFERQTFTFEPDDEDIHTAVERRLGEIIGPVAAKLHTGRSRNDQVATDLRLYLLEEVRSLRHTVVELQEAIVVRADEHVGVIMPGYTHLRQAQPLLFSHWLMSFFWKLQRDRERLDEVAKRTSVMPLGAGALAGNPFRINRQVLAQDLGFASISENSVDAVGDRDFVAEFLAWAALFQVHLSSLAEELALWAGPEFGFLELDERYATGSSLMPQKKNPDSVELMRAKTGRIVGHLVGVLTVLKGLPSGYNKDLQEDKEALFDVLDTLAVELPIAVGVVSTLRVHAQRMSEALDEGLLATDLADYLVAKGIPFRQSHHLVGQAVRRAEQLGISLSQLELAEYQAINTLFEVNVYEVFDFRRSVERRTVSGGTSLGSVRSQIERARRLLSP